MSQTCPSSQLLQIVVPGLSRLIGSSCLLCRLRTQLRAGSLSQERPECRPLTGLPLHQLQVVMAMARNLNAQHNQPLKLWQVEGHNKVQGKRREEARQVARGGRQMFEADTVAIR